MGVAVVVGATVEVIVVGGVAVVAGEVVVIAAGEVAALELILLVIAANTPYTDSLYSSAPSISSSSLSSGIISDISLSRVFSVSSFSISSCLMRDSRSRSGVPDARTSLAWLTKRVEELLWPVRDLLLRSRSAAAAASVSDMTCVVGFN